MTQLFDPNWWVSIGLLGTLLTAVSVIVQVVLNKKLRTPADEEVKAQNVRTWEKEAIAERNDILARYKTELLEAEARAEKLQNQLTALGERLQVAEQRIRDVETAHNASSAAWLHWGYKAIAMIRKLGGDDTDIPKPTPGAMNLGRARPSHK